MRSAKFLLHLMPMFQQCIGKVRKKYMESTMKFIQLNKFKNALKFLFIKRKIKLLLIKTSMIYLKNNLLKNKNQLL